MAASARAKISSGSSLEITSQTPKLTWIDTDRSPKPSGPCLTVCARAGLGLGGHLIGLHQDHRELIARPSDPPGHSRGHWPSSDRRRPSGPRLRQRGQPVIQPLKATQGDIDQAGRRSIPLFEGADAGQLAHQSASRSTCPSTSTSWAFSRPTSACRSLISESRACMAPRAAGVRSPSLRFRKASVSSFRARLRAWVRAGRLACGSRRRVHCARKRSSCGLLQIPQKESMTTAGLMGFYASSVAGTKPVPILRGVSQRVGRA